MKLNRKMSLKHLHILKHELTLSEPTVIINSGEESPLWAIGHSPGRVVQVITNAIQLPIRVTGVTFDLRRLTVVYLTPSAHVVMGMTRIEHTPTST